MYELADYLAMVDDHRRTSAYVEAMARVIRPGDRVLEIGTGIGFFAIHAARLGAAHVWAIEPNDAIEFGPALAELHGVADRITFVQGLSTGAHLPERADVLIEDLRGTSPLLRDRIQVLIDARARLLASDARVIPARDRLMVAPTDVPRHRSSNPAGGVAPVAGIDVSSVRGVVNSGLQRVPADSIEPLAPAACWAELDYATIESPDAAGEVEFTFAASVRVAGFASWFDAELAPGVGFSSGPAPERSVYDCGWLPLEHPIEATAGDRVTLRMRAKYDGFDYVWAWDATHRSADGVSSAPMRHSNLRALVRSRGARTRRAATHVPAPSAQLARLASVAALVDGRRSLGEIARAVRAGEPGAFSDEAAALRWVGEALARIDE